MKKNNEPSGLYEEIFEGERQKRLDQLQREAAREETARRSAAKGRRRTVRRVLTTFILVVLAILALVFLIYKLFFKITDLELAGSSHYDAATVFEVAGVKTGDNLFSFPSGAAFAKLKERCPYVKSLKVKREIPDKITFTVEEYDAVFYAYIYGRTCVLAEDLTVLELRRSRETVDGLCYISLPAAKEVICGEKITFRSEIDENRVYRVVESVLRSDLAPRINAILLADTFALSMECDRKYLMTFGDDGECDLKLRLAADILKKDAFQTGNKMKLDLTDVSQPTSLVDNTIVFH